MTKRENTLAIFTLVEHKTKNDLFYGYGPYVREMNLWVSNFDKVIVVAPFSKFNNVNPIDLAYTHSNMSLVCMPSFNVKSILSIVQLVFSLPLILIKMVSVMRKSHHLHFRCPSNIAAIAAMLQVFFPNKTKTVKYAGNWDPKSKQPLGYRFQKWLLSNTFLTKTIKILVYGEWNNQSKYVVPFYTATFSESEVTPFIKRDYSSKLKFVFLGALVEGKRPLLAIKIIEALIKKGLSSEFHMFGDGRLLNELRNYVKEKGLENFIILYGNKNMEIVKKHLQDAHFTILPSKSEGWPKALAEGMFFGAIPISTDVSCVSFMLDDGNRGIMIEPNLDKAADVIYNVAQKEDSYLISMARKAQEWSHQFTLERLEQDIKEIIKE